MILKQGNDLVHGAHIRKTAPLALPDLLRVTAPLDNEVLHVQHGYYTFVIVLARSRNAAGLFLASVQERGFCEENFG